MNVTGTSGALSLSGLGASSIALTGANNLLITANNFNATATGINNTAIGTDLQSSGAFTTLSASGTVTLSNLPFNGPVYATAGGVLTSEQYLSPSRGGTGLDASAAPNGSLLIGNGTGYTLATISGSLNQVNVTNGAGTITLSLPQDIALTSTPTFTGMNLTSTNNQLVLGNTNAANHTLTINSPSQTANVTALIPSLTNPGGDTFVFAEQAQTLDNKTIGSSGLVFSGATADINTQSGKDLTVSTTGLGTQIVLSSVVKLGTIASAPSYPNTATTLCRDDTSGQISQCPANAANVDLQQAYNAGNTITTNNNNNITFNLAGGDTTSFVLNNSGTAPAFVINDMNAGLGTVLEVQSATNPTLTVLENGTLSTVGNLITTGTGSITSASTLTAQATSNQLVLGTGSATTTFNSAAATAQTVNIPELLTSDSDTFAFVNEAQTLLNKTIGSSGLVFSGATADINTQSGKDLTVSTTGLGTQIVLSSVVKLGTIASAPSYPNTATTLCRDDTSGQISQCPANAANVDLQQAYNAGNTITTNNNNNIGFTLANGESTQFTLANAGNATSAFVISDANAAHNALQILSGATPTLTLGINGDITTPGNITTNSGGTITSAGLLTGSNGLTVTTGAINLTGTSGALNLSGLSASSIALTGANNLLITANNFNVTGTGINNTAIGATTQSSGAFTTLSASGTVTLSNLPFNGPVYATAGGVLTSEQYLSTTRGGTGLDTSLAQNGELLIGNGAGLSLGYIGGTLNQINVASTSGTITLSLPQDIALTSSPTFAGMNLTNTANQLMLGGSGAVTTISSTSSANQTITIPTLLTSNIDSFAFLNEAQTLTNKTIGSTGLVFSGPDTSADITTVSDQNLTLTPNGSGQIVLGSVVQLAADLPSAPTSATTLCRDDAAPHQIVQCPANAMNVTLQEAYNAGNTITTNNNNNIGFTLANGESTQFTLANAGNATSAFVISDANAAHNALQILSGATPTLTLGINGDITTTGALSSGNITSSGTITSQAVNNQLVLGNGNTTTINAIASSSSSWTATIPALTGNDTFVFTNQEQTLTNKSLVDGSTYLVNENYQTRRVQFDLSELQTDGVTRVITVPDMNGSLCLTTGNCAGTGGVVGGSGNVNRLAKFTADGSTIGNSNILDDGSLITALSGLQMAKLADATGGTPLENSNIFTLQGSY